MLASNSIKTVTVTPRSNLDQPVPIIGTDYSITGVVIESTKTTRENAELPAALRVFYSSASGTPKAGDLVRVGSGAAYLVSAVRDVSGVMSGYRFKLEAEREALL